MKHEVTTLNTKKAFAASLKKLMEKKSLSKISVSELIVDCGVNRKTFYYHFEDIHALLKWMLEQEAIEVVKQFDLMVNYEEAILFVMDYVDKNRHILNCAYDGMGRDGLKRFFYADFIGIIHALIDNAENNTGQYISMDFKNFLCDFYVEAMAGTLINWFRDNAAGDRDKTISYLVGILKASLPQILSSFSNHNSKQPFV